jgi:hypothetical protein
VNIVICDIIIIIIIIIIILLFQIDYIKVILVESIQVRLVYKYRSIYKLVFILITD